MFLARQLIFTFVASCFLGSQSIVDDPVMKIRMQRSQAQGVNEADLPPVPRSVLEPPPLPPPELHAKDVPHPLSVLKPSRIAVNKEVSVGSKIGSKPVFNRGNKKTLALVLNRSVKPLRTASVNRALNSANKKIVLRKTHEVLPGNPIRKATTKMRVSIIRGR